MATIPEPTRPMRGRRSHANNGIDPGKQGHHGRHPWHQFWVAAAALSSPCAGEPQMGLATRQATLLTPQRCAAPALSDLRGPCPLCLDVLLLPLRRLHPSEMPFLVCLPDPRGPEHVIAVLTSVEA